MCVVEIVFFVDSMNVLFVVEISIFFMEFCFLFLDVVFNFLMLF